MKQKLVIILWLLSLLTSSFAASFSCSRKHENGKIYLGDKVINLTNSADNLKCSKWLDKMTINTLNGNDEIDTLKSDKKWTKINLWDWNDIFNQNVDHWVLNWITIDGWNGYDKLIINKKKDRLVIDWNCANSCNIYLKDSDWNPWRKFKNITLKSIEEIDTPDWILKFEWNSNINDNNSSKWNNTQSNLGKTINNSGNNNEQSTEKLAPYSYKKFQHVLNQCKLTYPNGSKKMVDKWQFAWYKSGVFYADTQGNMIFDLKKTKDMKMRVELRQQQNHKDSWWVVNDNKIHTLIATVKLQKLNKALEYTFLQIHSEVHPLLRMAVEKTKRWENNHIWAIIRVNVNNTWKKTARYDLWAISENYDNFKVEVGNNNLKIYKNGKLYVDKDISYWPEKKNYFKAWIYDSKDSPPSFEIKIKFSQLDMTEWTNLGNTNNTKSTSKQENQFNIKPEWKLVGQYSKNKWVTYKTPNKILEINPWNISSTDGDAKMYYNSSNGVVTYIQDFYNIKQQNPGGYVLWYPEVYVWNKPWNGNYIDAWSKLPIKLSKLKSLDVEASWNYEHSKKISCNFAMEWWFTKNKFQKKGVGKWEVEMMIMWYKNIQWAAWLKVGETIIPVVVNWVLKDIQFDIYKANIGWDFVTFVPKNYSNFINANIKFDIKDFSNVTKKYILQLDNLYLEDWEFWTEYWTPNTREAKLAWKIEKFKVTWIENTENELTDFIDSSLKNNINNSRLPKIQNLKMTDKIYNNSNLNKYYPIFKKFFDDKKQKILANPKYINEDYYNYLNSFITYTNWLFTDLDNKNYKNIYSYIDMFKKIINKLEQL